MRAAGTVNDNFIIRPGDRTVAKSGLLMLKLLMPVCETVLSE